MQEQETWREAALQTALEDLETVLGERAGLAYVVPEGWKERIEKALDASRDLETHPAFYVPRETLLRAMAAFLA